MNFQCCGGRCCEQGSNEGGGAVCGLCAAAVDSAHRCSVAVAMTTHIHVNRNKLQPTQAMVVLIPSCVSSQGAMASPHTRTRSKSWSHAGLSTRRTSRAFLA